MQLEPDPDQLITRLMSRIILLRKGQDYLFGECERAGCEAPANPCVYKSTSGMVIELNQCASHLAYSFDVIRAARRRRVAMPTTDDELLLFLDAERNPSRVLALLLSAIRKVETDPQKIARALGIKPEIITVEGPTVEKIVERIVEVPMPASRLDGRLLSQRREISEPQEGEAEWVKWERLRIHIPISGATCAGWRKFMREEYHYRRPNGPTGKIEYHLKNMLDFARNRWGWK